MSFFKTGFDSRVFKMKIKKFLVSFSYLPGHKLNERRRIKIIVLEYLCKAIIRLYKLINVDYIKNLCKLTFGRSKYY